MQKTITINDYELPLREFNGQRVVTFKDIDTVHDRAEGTARKRFNENKKHFVEGVDFFKITPSEFRTAIGEMNKRQQNDITLITETGYLMLVKSFTDELAWDVQRALVNGYFRAEVNEKEYLTKSTSVSEIATMIKTLRVVMKEQGSNPVKIAIMAKNLCQQFGINIPQDFVEVSPWEQLTISKT